MTKLDTTPRIFVGAYANPTYGQWYDLANFDHDEHMEKYPLHEEVGIMDYEYCTDGYSIEALQTAYAELDEDDDRWGLFLEGVKDGYWDIDAAWELDDNMAGCYESWEDYAWELYDEALTGDTPEIFRNFFDYKKKAHDLEIEESYIEYDGKIHIINNR